ncbi:hypothetical protein LTR65_004448 [Meristemomyces frigidus]
MAQQRPCLLLELPPELRNRIFESVLVSQDEELILENQPSPALLRTCRQIRDEASSLYYAQPFLLTNAEKLCIPWLASVPPKMRNRIKTIRMYTKCCLSGRAAAKYKAGLQYDLYRIMHRRRLGMGITLEVFLELDRKSSPIWTADPMKQYCKQRFLLGRLQADTI